MVFTHDGRSPRVELPYAYLAAWFALHLSGPYSTERTASRG